MEKAAFFRNISNYSMLCNHSSQYKGIVVEYNVVATVVLDTKKFNSFCDNFQRSYDFLMPYMDKAIVQRSIWKCVMIKHEDTKLLVVMNHYQYPRYSAIISN